jgi:hypothetical protein
MQGWKQQLKEELQAEEQQVELMTERLKETNRVGDIAHDMTGKIELGVARFQASVRQRQAIKLFHKMQCKSCARKAIVLFFQHPYRGWRGWVCAESRIEFLRPAQRDESASAIQGNVQRVIQRQWYLDLLLEKKRLSNQSAAAIQAMTKGRITRQMYQAEMKWQRDAAGNGERVWRGQVARIMANKQQEELIQRSMDTEKPKGTPLRLRRYSTYSSNNNTASMAKAQGLKKHSARMRRWSSNAMINMDDGHIASTGDGRDKNDSIASKVNAPN